MFLSVNSVKRHTRSMLKLRSYEKAEQENLVSVLKVSHL